MITISASDARQTLPAQLDRVEAGEEVSITRHGKVVAVLVSPESVRPPRARRAWEMADRIGEMLDDARRQPSPIQDGLSSDDAEAVVIGIRADRDAE